MKKTFFNILLITLIFSGCTNRKQIYDVLVQPESFNSTEKPIPLGDSFTFLTNYFCHNSTYKDICESPSGLFDSQKEETYIFTILLLLFLISTLIVAIAWWASKTLIKEKTILQKYTELQKTLSHTQREMELLRTIKEEYMRVIEQKERQISDLKEQIGAFKRSQGMYLLEIAKQGELYKTDAYISFKKKTFIGEKATESEFAELEEALKNHIPNFYNFMQTIKPRLNEKEYYTCVLFRIGFSSGDAATLLDVSRAYISKISSQLSEKVFQVKENSKHFKEHIAKMC